MTSSKSSNNTKGSTRRKFLIATGTISLTGFAGCSGGGNGTDTELSGNDTGANTDTELSGNNTGTDGTNTGGSGNGGGSIESTTVGVLSPMTGAYSSLGPAQREGAKLAIQRANEKFDVELTAVYGDTETSVDAAQQEAQRVVQQEGAEYIVGAVSSSVALGLNEFAAAEKLVYYSGAAAVSVTGENCNEWVFRTNAHTAQIAEAISAYSVNNLGTNVWFHIADYAYGNSVYNRVSSRMQEANDSYQEIGVTRSQLGSTNYDSFISQISNSNADIAVLGMTGGDLINFVNQAADQGLTDQVDLVGPTMTFQSVRAATGANAVGTYGGVRYLPSIETDHNQEFVNNYQSEYESTPDVFARDSYDAIHMMAQTMQEIGDSEPEKVKDEMAGRPLSTVFGDVQFRPCDHQAENPTWMGKLVQDDSDVAAVERVSKVEGPKTLPSCDEVGCNL